MRQAFASPAPRLFKAVASGNDFLVADARGIPGWDPGPDGAAALCRRNLGLGADGLIVLHESSRAEAAFFLRNRDGSTAHFSGNGARCAALLLHELGASRPGGHVGLELQDRIALARVLEIPADQGGGAPLVEVSVGEPRDVALSMELPPGSPVAHGDYAVVGVPYLALRVEDADLDGLDLPRLAPPLRHWSALPHGANVAFYSLPPGGGPVRLRTWERGVEGETQSSGTGCAMVALALQSRDAGAMHDGERLVELAPPSRDKLAVTVVRQGSRISDLVLRGDARLLGEITPLRDALLRS